MQMTPDNIINSAKRTIRLEQESIAGLQAYINESFVKATEAILSAKGRVVISGIGKSAIIAQKIVATLNSTGTPSLFMHAVDAIHGDLGMVQQEDIVMLISKSGDSPEIKVLTSLIKNFGNLLIGMVGNTHSFLAKQCDIVLDTTIEQEACPNNLAPTTSTTAQMVMGDALAVCLMEQKGFGNDEFAKFHPGGMLGKKLYLRASDLYSQNEKPRVLPTASIKEVIMEMTKKRLGATAVVDENNLVCGIVTDGDLRRMLENNTHFTGLTAKDIMTPGAKKIAADTLAVDVLETLRKHNISQLIITENDQYLGIVHLHDLVREGII